MFCILTEHFQANCACQINIVKRIFLCQNLQTIPTVITWTCVNVLTVATVRQCKEHKQHIVLYSWRTQYLFLRVLPFNSSHSYPDVVAPCFGLHPLQGGEGPEQRSVKPQVVKQSALHPAFDHFTSLILRVTVSRLLSGVWAEDTEGGRAGFWGLWRR